MRPHTASLALVAVAAGALLVRAVPRGGPGFVSAPGASPGDPAVRTAAVQVTVKTVATGLDNVVGGTAAGDGTGRLFIIEKKGLVRIIEDNALVPRPFLDITDRVSTPNSQNAETGLLGIAFHPDYAAKGAFFVNYTGRGPRGLTSYNSRFRVTADPGVADPESEERLLEYRQPAGNHNGGSLAFGPDGFLYIGVGDGGGGGDPSGNGQNKGTLLGALLRIDVDGGDPYVVPESNPFLGQPGAAPEIWAMGLRNPWRFSFDGLTGDLYIADVGQNEIEEVDFQPADSPGGENYGWNIMEGSSCYDAPRCDRRGLTLPAVDYRHSIGCSVTGGFVYRGTEFPPLQGLYIFGDWCSRRLWAMSRDATGAWGFTEVGRAPMNIASFAEGEDGSIFVMGLGTVGRIVQEGMPTSTAPAATDTPTSAPPSPTQPGASATPPPSATAAPPTAIHLPWVRTTAGGG